MVDLAPLPTDPDTFISWTWADYEPYVADLLRQRIDVGTVEEFLDGWSAVERRIGETDNRLYIATVVNTADEAATDAYLRFVETVLPAWEEARFRLQERMLAGGLEPAGFEVPLQKMRADVAIFREENIPLLTEERKLEERYNRIAGAQSAEWRGEELPLPQLAPFLQDPDRSVREAAWRASINRQLADREAFNALWAENLAVRRQQAANAGFPDYRALRWQQMHRFDYAPADCLRFDEAIAEVVVPAATRLLERRRRQLGVETLRPWDTAADPLGRPPLRPFQDARHLTEGSDAIFRHVDPAFAAYWETMDREGLLELESRKNKGPGGFCIPLNVIRRPFIFMNAAGLHEDVQTVLHEGGHAFHIFESSALRWEQQIDVGAEFSEVASMGMELLAGPYLAAPDAGFYDSAQAARARIEHLESIILFWPYMAVVDAFQHWVYEHPDDAADPARCDQTWAALYRRYHPGLDWDGLEDALATGWHRKLHIFCIPFYYVDYGLAQLGSVQVWANARRNQADAVARYRGALSLGGTRSIPALFEAAGGRLAFDAATLREAVELLESALAELEPQT
jgi:oligoendopeptidase F